MKLALCFAPFLAALTLAVSAEAATSTATQAWQFKDDSAGGLEIDNLVGDVTIERGAAAGFYVSVKVTAEAASAQEADIIARSVEFSVLDAGSSSRLQVLLPEAKFPTIYIAGVPEGWWVGGAKTEYLGEKRRVTGNKGKGAQVRVDILVRAPGDARLAVRNLFGDAATAGFGGELRLDGENGRLSVRGGSGKVELDSGSGPVEVSDHSGSVNADTGSGSVTISDCRCRISADTGSGSVRINGGEGEIDADTGSGSVTIRDFKGSLAVDTGSGAVSATGISGLERLVSIPAQAA
jgi:phage baseplate assembly protein gpV